MSKWRVSSFAASAVIFFAGAAAALDPSLLALNTPVKAGIKVQAGQKITAEQKAAAEQPKPAVQPKAGYTDFDAVSVNDPLYREGAKEMLKQVLKDEESPKAEKKPALRDAPISRDAKPVRLIKKTRVKKPLHTDPVKAQDSL